MIWRHFSGDRPIFGTALPSIALGGVPKVRQTVYLGGQGGPVFQFNR